MHEENAASKRNESRRFELLDSLYNDPVSFAHQIGFDKLGDLHNEWMCEMLNGEGDETLQAHRNSYKTTCVSVVLVILLITRPRLRIAFFRKTDDDVKEIVQQVSNILKDDFVKMVVWLIWEVELALTVDNACEIDTNLSRGMKGSCQLTAMGIKGSMTGKHYDIIFTDDIVTLEDRESPAERRRTITRYSEIINLLNKDPGCKVFNTGTPWHKDDAFTIMPAPKKYDCYTTGILTKSAIDHIKKYMTKSLFAANYELKHISDEEVLFAQPGFFTNDSLLYGGIGHLDSAYGGADYTAFSIIRKADGKYYLFGKVWQRNVEDCYQEITLLYNEFKCAKMYTETNADKGMVAKDLRKKCGLRVVSYQESMNKYIKISLYLKAIWEDVVVSDKTDNAYLNMITDYNINAEHDDAPDSAACLARLTYKPKPGEIDVVKEQLKKYDLNETLY